MSRAAEILDMDDIRNLADIYDMFTAIISRSNLSVEDYKSAHKTLSNLAKLLAELSEPSGQPV